MIISIMGAGNAATVLGKIFKKHNHKINEIIGRNKIAVRHLAKELSAKPCFELNQFNKNSDIYIIAVKDDAVAAVSAQINLDEQPVLHTSGSLPIEVLAKASKNFGVLYPVQSLRKELNYNPLIPFLIDGNSDFTKKIILKLASSVSENVISADNKTRLQYHLAAIVVSNFTNHLLALAKEYCDSNNTDFNLLLPLIEETVNRLHYHEPSAMQTGPAARGDEEIIRRHLHLLHASPELKKVYELMSESIKYRHKQ